MLLLSACSDDWKENALTAKFTFDKTTYYVGEEVSITNETVGGEGNYTCQWDLGNGETSTEVAPKVTYETNGAYTVRKRMNFRFFLFFASSFISFLLFLRVTK